ncbi:Regulator of RNase E activity RraA [Litoreibacter ascidiaceicola]|uniref:Putative 4-hydroxy-4-methyl-2-oxoglutarate aldolase n=1 Tax=Litoreibacter ascidiaceicola TaxID=1486859 RepID=A0A1M4T7G9_9RHOB|nr:RraA family protein [Litoreibacter ascidiaceicola]SHE40340.1 Regulator of RNase E activity RraA [Litoreibacter ascidiaceicola]
MRESLLTLLRSVDTPTVCNAIEVAQGKRGFNDFTRGTMLINEPTGVVVGYASTAKIAAISPPTEPPEVIRTRRMAYYKQMADAPQPSVCVVEDEDYPNAIGAFWGEVNTEVHKGLGMSGTLTNGVMRDLGDMAPDYPVVAGSIGPSHGFVHVTALDVPVTVFGMTVRPGDLVHADRHGAVVVPPEVIDQLETAIRKMQETEHLVLGPAREEGFNFAKFEAAWAAFEKART